MTICTRGSSAASEGVDASHALRPRVEVRFLPPLLLARVISLSAQTTKRRTEREGSLIWREKEIESKHSTLAGHCSFSF
ncbi:hypothetical protein ACLOJK_011146 [Asimina triloba]